MQGVSLVKRLLSCPGAPAAAAAAAGQPQQQRSRSSSAAAAQAAAAAAASVCSHRACSWSRAVSAHTFRSNPHTKRKISIRFNITVRHVQDQLAKVIPLDGPMVLMVGSWRSKLFIQYHSIQQLVRRHNRKCNSAMRAHMRYIRKSGARTCVVCRIGRIADPDDRFAHQRGRARGHARSSSPDHGAHGVKTNDGTAS